MDDVLLVSGNMAYNHNELMKARGLASVLAGVVAGILRVEGVVYGAIFFVLVMLASSLVVVHHVQKVSDYFAEPASVYTNGLSSGLMGFVLSWTVVYNLCHIF